MLVGWHAWLGVSLWLEPPLARLLLTQVHLSHRRHGQSSAAVFELLMGGLRIGPRPTPRPLDAN